MSRIILQPKFAGETITETFDFSSYLAEDATIDSASVTASVYQGEDATPSAVIDGTATISGQSVLQSITGGVLGVIYTLLCTANCSDDQILQLSAYLTISPSVP